MGVLYTYYTQKPGDFPATLLLLLLHHSSETEREEERDKRPRRGARNRRNALFADRPSGILHTRTENNRNKGGGGGGGGEEEEETRSCSGGYYPSPLSPFRDLFKNERNKFGKRGAQRARNVRRLKRYLFLYHRKTITKKQLLFYDSRLPLRERNRDEKDRRVIQKVKTSFKYCTKV